MNKNDRFVDSILLALIFIIALMWLVDKAFLLLEYVLIGLV